MRGLIIVDTLLILFFCCPPSVAEANQTTFGGVNNYEKPYGLSPIVAQVGIEPTIRVHRGCFRRARPTLPLSYCANYKYEKPYGLSLR